MQVHLLVQTLKNRLKLIKTLIYANTPVAAPEVTAAN